MRITIVNYATPFWDSVRQDTRWWHKAGSRWPASLVNRRNDGSEYFPYPFLLGYLKSLLSSRGHCTTLLDGCVRKWTPPEAEEAIRQSRPEFILFEISEQTEATDRGFVKRLAGLAPICLIGPSVAEDRTDLLEWPGVVAAIPGEYLVSTADFLENPQPGLAPRKEVLGIEAMDALPFAYRDPEDYPRYNARYKTTPAGMQAQFVSMWGCQYRCKFCIWIHSYWPKSSQKQKHFSVPRLAAELEDLLERFPQTTSLFDDCDNHHLGDAEATAYAEAMGRTGRPWAILTRADTFMFNGEINYELWRHYRANGCYGVKIGIEGVQEAMDATNKRLSEKEVRDFVAFMKSIGISVYASFMVGVPGTAAETDRRTMDFAESLARDRPELFEYFISSCDVTQTTPFAAVRTGGRNGDGQYEFERRLEREGIAFASPELRPLNLPLIDGQV